MFGKEKRGGGSSNIVYSIKYKIVNNKKTKQNRKIIIKGFYNILFL